MPMRKVESMTNDPFDALGHDDPVVEPDADFVARLGRRLGVRAEHNAALQVAPIDLVRGVVTAPVSRRRRGFLIPLAAAIVALAVITVGVARSHSRRVSTVPSDAISDVTAAPVAVTTISPTATTNSESNSEEPGMFDVSTVEDLTRTSDLIGFVQTAQKLDGLSQAIASRKFQENLAIVDVQFSDVLRGEATRHTLVLLTKEQAALIVGKPVLLFLRTPAFDLAEQFFPAANLVGPIITLTPSSNSIMVPDGTDLFATGNGFTGLRRKETFDGPAMHRLPRRDVVAVASDPTIGPTIPWPRQDPPPSRTEADNAWLARLDASCAAAKQRADELTTILTNANAPGSIRAGDAVRVLDLFAQLRGGEAALNDQSGVSADIIARWERSKALLAAAESLLTDAIPRTGADLTDSLVKFRQKAGEYQSQWSGVPAPHCTMFL
jgi:hypothetical protein